MFGLGARSPTDKRGPWVYVRIKDAGARPTTIREPVALRTAYVDGLGTFALDGPTILLARPRPAPQAAFSPT